MPTCAEGWVAPLQLSQSSIPGKMFAAVTKHNDCFLGSLQVFVYLIMSVCLSADLSDLASLGLNGKTGNKEIPSLPFFSSPFTGSKCEGTPDWCI